MCLTVGRFRTRAELRLANAPQIRTRDFTVYKVLTNSNQAPYRHTYYPKGKDMEVKKFGKWQDDNGYGDSKWFLKIDEGLHAFKTKDAAFERLVKLGNQYHKIVEYLVPAGTPFFFSHDKKEIVTLKLKWKKKSYGINTENWFEVHKRFYRNTYL